MVLHHNHSICENYSMFDEVYVEIPIFLEISWKSWGEGLQKLVKHLNFLVVMPDHYAEWSYQYFAIWYVDRPWTSPKIFLKYSTGFKSLKKRQNMEFCKKIVPGSWNKKKPKGYFDARTEFDFVTFLVISRSIIDRFSFRFFWHTHESKLYNLNTLRT